MSNSYMLENGKLNDVTVTKPFCAMDIAKFVMAILVVALHTKPFASLNNEYVNVLFNAIVSLAVPFFFMCTGFLLENRILTLNEEKQKQEVITRYLIKIIKLYVIWTIIYLPLDLYSCYISEDSVIYCIFKYIAGFFLIGEHDNSWILWYLLSTIYTLFFILICNKLKFNIKIIFALGLIIYLLRNILLLSIDNTIFLAVKKVLVNGRIFTGLFYIPLGMIITKNVQKKFVCIMTFLVGLSGTIIFNRGGVVNDIFLALCEIGLFTFIISIELVPKKIYIKLRNMSTWIYFIHMYIWTIFDYLMYSERHRGLYDFLVTCIASIVVSMIIINVKPKIKKLR